RQPGAPVIPVVPSPSGAAASVMCPSYPAALPFTPGRRLDISAFRFMLSQSSRQGWLEPRKGWAVLRSILGRSTTRLHTALAMLGLAVIAGLAPSSASAATLVKTIGFPGPAGLYAYGMDWDASDNTILVGDYWNYRVKRYTTDGQLVGSVSQHALGGLSGGITAPYDVEADPTDLNSSGKAALWVADQGSSR